MSFWRKQKRNSKVCVHSALISRPSRSKSSNSKLSKLTLILKWLKWRHSTGKMSSVRVCGGKLVIGHCDWLGFGKVFIGKTQVIIRLKLMNTFITDCYIPGFGTLLHMIPLRSLHRQVVFQTIRNDEPCIALCYQSFTKGLLHDLSSHLNFSKFPFHISLLLSFYIFL